MAEPKEIKDVGELEHELNYGSSEKIVIEKVVLKKILKCVRYGHYDFGKNTPENDILSITEDPDPSKR